LKYLAAPFAVILELLQLTSKEPNGLISACVVVS
jgi:hypothetical protein